MHVPPEGEGRLVQQFHFILMRSFLYGAAIQQLVQEEEEEVDEEPFLQNRSFRPFNRIRRCRQRRLVQCTGLRRHAVTAFD